MAFANGIVFAAVASAFCVATLMHFGNDIFWLIKKLTCRLIGLWFSVAVRVCIFVGIIGLILSVSTQFWRHGTVWVDRDIIDFGANEVGAKVDGSLRITNSSHEVKSLSLRVSCSCISLSQSEVILEPGKSKTIDISTKVQNVGSQEYLISIDDGDCALPISLRLVGKNAPVLVPVRANLGLVPSDTPWTRSIDFTLSGATSGKFSIEEVSLVGGHPFHLESYFVQDPKNSSKFVVEIRSPASFDGQGSYETQLTVTDADGKTYFGTVIVDFVKTVSPSDAIVFVRPALDRLTGTLFLSSPFGELSLVSARSLDGANEDLGRCVSIIEASVTGVELEFQVDSIDTQMELEFLVNGFKHSVPVKVSIDP